MINMYIHTVFISMHERCVCIDVCMYAYIQAVCSHILICEHVCMYIYIYIHYIRANYEHQSLVNTKYTSTYTYIHTSTHIYTQK